MSKPDITPKYSPVFVIWDDAFSIDEWTPANEVCEAKNTSVHSIGFLIKRTKHHLILALNHDVDNDMLSCIIYIPTSMIKALIPLDK